MNEGTSNPAGPDEELNAGRIRQLVHDFYADVRADAALGPVFDRAIGDTWPQHLDRMVDFWSTVMLQSRSFKGNVYGKHMALDGVERHHFHRWLDLWTQHTNRLFAQNIAEEFQRVAGGIGRMLQHGFFGDPLPRAGG